LQNARLFRISHFVRDVWRSLARPDGAAADAAVASWARGSRGQTHKARRECLIVLKGLRRTAHPKSGVRRSLSGHRLSTDPTSLRLPFLSIPADARRREGPRIALTRGAAILDQADLIEAFLKSGGMPLPPKRGEAGGGLHQSPALDVFVFGWHACLAALGHSDLPNTANCPASHCCNKIFLDLPVHPPPSNQSTKPNHSRSNPSLERPTPDVREVAWGSAYPGFTNRTSVRARRSKTLTATHTNEIEIKNKNAV